MNTDTTTDLQTSIAHAAPGGEAPFRKKRKHPVSCVALTRQALEKLGFTVGKVEQRLPMPGRPFGLTRDLFGFADLMAFKPGRVLLVQATDHTSFSAHVKKIEAEPRALAFLQAAYPHTQVELWTWGIRMVKNKKGTKIRRRTAHRHIMTESGTWSRMEEA